LRGLVSARVELLPVGASGVNVSLLLF
jgi:hypothetical protein